ncbi:MAG TPA: hypothetical protein VG815_16560 [Chloroflexota bacterium]|jgi:hypothetical protein|nr:hypothetical protein [Chloroflexota bacterium]
MEPSAYLEHLTDADISVLVEVSHSGDSTTLRELLDEGTDRLRDLLASEALYDALFGSDREEAFLGASPFLIFAVLVSRAHVDLKRTSFVDEWQGPSRRLPVFQVDTLQAFSADMAHQLFLAEVLTSYTRVASGSFWVHTPRGWQRQRYSDLDLMRLVELLDIVPDSQRAGVLRRLGDLALFLSGVFPDFSATRPFRPGTQRRLESAVGVDGSNSGTVSEDLSTLNFLELIGSASYRQAAMATERSAGNAGTLRNMAGNFGDARRVLNFVTDKYLFPFRDRWFMFG